MKKLTFIVICTCIFMCPSCNDVNKSELTQNAGIENSNRNNLPKIELKTSSDTLSYALGIDYFYWSNLNFFIKQPQRELIADTVSTYSSYVYKINSTDNQNLKKQLIKEMRSKIDSITDENENRLALFSKGLKDVLVVSDKQNAYDLGVSVGVGIKDYVLAAYAEDTFGSKEDVKLIDKDVFIAALIAAIRGRGIEVDDAQMIVAKTKKQIKD